MNNPTNPYSAHDPVLPVISKVSEKLESLESIATELRQAARANQDAIRRLRHLRAKLVVLSLLVAFFFGGAVSAALAAVYWMPREVVKVIRSLQR